MSEPLDGEFPVSAFRADVLGHLDGVALTAQVSAGEVSARELAEAAIGRAEATQPRLDAVAFADVAGPPNRFWSRAGPDTPASESSPAVQQLDSTGLVTLGVSTCPSSP